MLRFLKLGSLYIFDEDKNKEVCKCFDISLITYRLLQASLINNTILSIRKCQNSYQNTHPDSVRRKQSPLVDGKLVKLWMGIVQKWSLLLRFLIQQIKNKPSVSHIHELTSKTWATHGTLFLVGEVK